LRRLLEWEEQRDTLVGRDTGSDETNGDGTAARAGRISQQRSGAEPRRVIDDTVSRQLLDCTELHCTHT